MDTNLNKFKASFADALNISVDLVTNELSYQSIPEWDSVSHMVLISQLEETFDISINTDDVIDMSSVGKAIEIISKYNIDFKN